jgi:tetratricopeptide (TPR) repeat protein
MTHPSLTQTVERYEAAIVALEAAGDRLSAEQILEVLAARELVREAVTCINPMTFKDRLATLRAVVFQRKPLSAHRRWLRRIKHLDHRLGEQSNYINQAIQLEDWHVLLHPPERNWLQLLNPPPEPPWHDRFDWLWQGLSIALLTVSLSILTDIARRFFEGGPDAIGAFTVIVPSVMGLLTGGALTRTGQQVINHILGSLNIARHWWDELVALSAALLLASLIGFWLLLPQVARLYEARADFYYQQGRLSSAESGYLRALKLSPSLLDIHYKLGRLYEDWRDEDRALTEYQVAVKGASEAGEAYKAHDRLARLYILRGGQENYSKAVSLLNEGLGLALARNDREVLYAIHKDLGWARLKQERYTEAINSLQRAISIYSEKAPGYCLVAQAHDGVKNRSAALTAWEQCLRYANQKDPDEDYWIGLALKRLQAERDQTSKQP